MGRVLKWTLAGLGVVIILGAVAVWLLLRASLPETDGTLAVAGVNEPVEITRDEQGVPTIQAADRGDLAFATGFLHGQERFLQMDILRRSAAGEMAGLVGGEILPLDRQARRWRLRRVAESMLADMPSDQRALAEAYAEGVNSGVEKLGARPPEYLFLGARPEPWQPEDMALVVMAMGFYLNDAEANRDLVLDRLARHLPQETIDFLLPRPDPMDAPLIEEPWVGPPSPPGPEVFDARELEEAPFLQWEDFKRDMVDPLGSNNWAVSGDLSPGDEALLSGDMHLGLSLPNTWYRMQWKLDKGEESREVVGITLPGAPAMVVGSNGHLAWTFTNSYGHFSTRVRLEEDPDNEGHYLTPTGSRALQEHEECIEVRRADAYCMEVSTSSWGPVVEVGEERHALVWTGASPEAVNMNLLAMEKADDLEEGLATAATAGIPPQNVLIADAEGRIGWTIAGALPKRGDWIEAGKRLPKSSEFTAWEGFLDPEAYPRVVDPPHGRLWSANARVAGGEHLRMIGDGGYDAGARQGQIRDRLFEADHFDEADMLEIQLDDEARFLHGWIEIALEAADVAESGNGTAQFRELVANWGGHAAVDSAGYRVLRAFRREVAGRALGPMLTPVLSEYPDLRLIGFRRVETPLQTLLAERPEHFLIDEFEDWDALLADAVDSVVARFDLGSVEPEEIAWGERNRVRVRHPFSEVLPAVGAILDMPEYRLPGDNTMPRVQTTRFGASQRMSISPGREEDGYFHMPGGQSGHFMSPWYGAGHEDWARGRATPLLPGETAHTLELEPE